LRPTVRLARQKRPAAEADRPDASRRRATADD
jgi:hypothetical protein